MSSFACEVVEIKGLMKHPNADNLSVTAVFGYPIVVRTADFKEGDKAVYVPVDAIVPLTNPKFSFLQKARIRASRLRGIFSMGLLVGAEEDMKIGDNVAERLGVTKWEEPDPTISNKGNLKLAGDAESVPFLFVRYTDIENMRRWPEVFQTGEPVVITEKLHGANSRFIYQDGRLWVGSHNTAKKPSDSNMWWKLAREYKLEEKLAKYPGVFLFGEAYGRVQDLHYGHEEGKASLAFFDAFDLKTGSYIDWDKFVAICQDLDLPIVPVMYEGGWQPNLVSLADGDSNKGGNIREGIVVKALMESFDMRIGRKILKFVSEAYLTRKGGSERH